MTVLIRFRERAGQVWLEADYDGLEPPLALFDDLRMIGWSPPVPAPPPASALDWDHPDPAQGTKYSVRPFRVTGARVGGPSGSGRSGTWTVGERPVYLRTLEGVLGRHAADVIAHLPPDAEPLQAARPVGEDRAAELLSSLPPPPAGGEAGPHDVSVEATSVPTGGHRVSAVLDRAVGSVVVARLRAEGHEPTLAAATLTKVVTFRGNQQESQVPAVRIDVVVAASSVVTVSALLASDGVSEGVSVEPSDEVSPSAAPTFAPPVIEEAPAPVSVSVSALVPLAAAPGSRGRLEGRGLEVRAEAAVVIVRGSYRGNAYVEEIPGQRLTVDTDERHLDAVIDLVVTATGVKRDDVDRLVVHRPTSPEASEEGRAGLGGPNLRLVS